MDHEWDYLAGYAALIKPLLRLQDYVFDFVPMEGPEPLEVARVDILPGYFRVKVEIAERFWDPEDHTSDDQQRTIVHEMCHVHVDKVAHHFQFIGDHVNTPAYYLFMESVKVDKEFLTDTMARMVMPWLPKLRQLH